MWFKQITDDSWSLYFSFPFSASNIQLNEDLVSGKYFTRFKQYPCAHVYECSKRKSWLPHKMYLLPFISVVTSTFHILVQYAYCFSPMSYIDNLPQPINIVMSLSCMFALHNCSLISIFTSTVSHLKKHILCFMGETVLKCFSENDCLVESDYFVWHIEVLWILGQWKPTSCVNFLHAFPSYPVKSWESLGFYVHLRLGLVQFLMQFLPLQ